MPPSVRLADLPSTVYLFPVDRFILLPETILPVVVTDAESRKVLEAAESTSRYLGVIQTRPQEKGSGRRFFDVGCLGRIRSLERTAEAHRAMLDGLIRFRVREELPGGEEAMPRAAVTYEEFEGDLQPVEENLEGWDAEGFRAALLRLGRLPSERGSTPLEAMSGGQLARVLVQTAPLAAAEKQALLEARSFRDMLALLFELLALNFLTSTPDASPSSRAN